MFDALPEAGVSYEPLGTAELNDHDGNKVRFTVGSNIVEVTALAPDLFRVGMFPEGRPPNYDSPAIDKGTWDDIEVSIENPDGEITISTDAATARVSLNPFRVSFEDSSGTCLRRGRRGPWDGPRAAAGRRRLLGAAREPGASLQEAGRGRAVLRLRPTDRWVGENRLQPNLLEHRPADGTH